MKDVQEIQAEFDISRIQSKAANKSVSYKFISEIADALGIKVNKNEGGTRYELPFYYITENGLSVFASDHKVAVVYQPDETPATTHYLFPNQDLKMAILSAYKDARIEIQKRKEQEKESDFNGECTIS